MMMTGRRVQLVWSAMALMVSWLVGIGPLWAQDGTWTTFQNAYIRFDYPSSWSKTELYELPVDLTSMIPDPFASLVTMQLPVIQLTTPDGQSALVYAAVGTVSWAVAGLGLIPPGLLTDTTSDPGALAGATGRLVALANQHGSLIGALSMSAPQQLFESMNNAYFNRMAQSFCLVQDNTCYPKKEP